MTSHDLRSHEQTQLSDFINKSPSNDWAHLSTVVAKETADITDRIQNLINKVCLGVVMVTISMHLMQVSDLEASCEQLKDQLTTEQQSHQQNVDQVSTEQDRSMCYHGNGTSS